MLTRFWDEWHCAVGEWMVWTTDDATQTAMANAPLSDIAASYIQVDHLRSGAGVEGGIQRKVLVVFVIHEVFDADAMTRTVNEFVRAHDVFHTGFAVSSAPNPPSRTISPDDIAMVVAADSVSHPHLTVKEYLHDQVPTLDEWAAFAFGVAGIDNAGSESANPRFEVAVAIDHMYTDANSLAMTFFEIVARYAAARAGEQYTCPVGRPYRKFAAEQRELETSLTATHPAVRQWREVVQRGKGMPRFPLPLGLAPGETAPSVFVSHSSVIDAQKADAFAARAKAAGASMSSALLAVMAEVYHRLNGERLFTMLMPRTDRTGPGDTLTLGWYVTRVPVQFEVADTFEQTARNAYGALRVSKQLDRVPVYPVIDVLADDPGFPVEHGFAAPMLSYVDGTRVPGLEFAHHHEIAAYIYTAPANEVFTWINQDQTGMYFNTTRPNTPEASHAVGLVCKMLYDRIVEIAESSLAAAAS